MSSPSGRQKTLSAPRPGVRPRYAFLDGLRGLAALYVVLFHLVYQEAALSWGRLSPAVRAGLAPFSNGRYAVAVFIVLSGFCLMLPVISAGSGQVPGGMAAFFRRRARRILPPYYAALAFTLSLIVLTYWRKRDPAGLGVFEPGNLLSHLFLFHHLSRDWAQTIDPPMWSVGVEWHIYFLFPTLLLPLWRRLGSIPVILGALALGLMPHFLLPEGRNFDWARPWYLGLFAMGMAAAVVSHGNTREPTCESHPWGLTALGGAAVVWVVGWLFPSRQQVWAADAAVGITAALLLIFCARAGCAPPTGARRVILRLLEARGVTALGHFSYSLYLLHLPAWWLLQPFIRSLRLSPELALVARLMLGLPWVLALSYGFYLLVERRFSPPAGAKDGVLAVRPVSLHEATAARAR